MENQTHGEPTEDEGNQEQMQTQDEELLRRKSGYDQHTNPSCSFTLNP